MSERKEEKSEKDYRAMIRARAESSSQLRQRIFEKVERDESLRQKVELAKEEKKSKD